jgi:hypothetical protein
MHVARTVFYSLGSGLGHLNRSLAVIRHLRRLAPTSEAVVVTNSPFCQLALSVGVPVVRLPGHFEQEMLRVPDLTAKLSIGVFDSLGPLDALVVDANLDQLPPAVLAYLKKGRFLKVFICRQEAVMAMDQHLAAFDYVFYPFPRPAGGVPAGMTACGYIVTRGQQDVLTREQARLRLGLEPESEEPLILAHHACSPAEILALFRQVKVASQLMGLPHELRLSTPQVLPGVEYVYPHLVSIYPIMDVLEAADLVVCSAGYNSFAEVNCLGRPAIFWPLERQNDHQDARASHFPSFGPGTPPAELAEVMRGILTSPARVQRGKAEDYHGAEKVAEAIANAMAIA